jgi:hypothetical protein
MQMKTRLLSTMRRCAVWAGVLLALASCGGGGGDAPPAPGPSVTVGSPDVTSIAAAILVGDPMHDVLLTGTVSGDLASLNGRTIFVIVEDPGGLFVSTPPPSLVLQNLSATTVQYALTLRGMVMPAVTRRTGTMRVFVCLDLACASPLGGIPILLPYDVQVIPGLTVDPKTFDITVPFGTTPPDQIVSVAVTDYSPSRAWKATDPNVPNPNTKLTIVNDGLLQVGTQLTFRLATAPPGVYLERIRVHTTAIVGPSQTRDFDEFIDITYTVTP